MAPEAPPKFRIAFVYYSMYGHIKQLINTAAKGIQDSYGSDAEVKIFTVHETLPDDVLVKIHVPPRDPTVPIITPNDLKNFDGIVWGIPTRYGRAAAQISTFFDSTRSLWLAGALKRKLTTIITSTASQGGGQESTAMTSMYVKSTHQLVESAGTFAGHDGQRQPSAIEPEVVRDHGIDFAEVVSQFKTGPKVQK